MTQHTYIQWTVSKLEAFKERYAVARDIGDVHFKFEGRTFYGPFAGYLIEYLEEELGVSK